MGKGKGGVCDNSGVPRYIFGMTMIITRAELFCRAQRSTELIAKAKDTSNGSIWPLYVSVQSVGRRIVTQDEIDS